MPVPGGSLARAPRRDRGFRTTPAGGEWLDAYAQRAADQILTARADTEVVVGHAAWILAFNARWELARREQHGHPGTGTSALLQERREDYLAVTR